MKRSLQITAVLISLLLPAVSVLRAQDDAATLKKFSGGSINFEFFMSNWLLTGPGQKSASLGGTFSSYSPNVEDVFNSPAGIGYIEKAGAMLEMSPLLPISITSFVDVEEMIQDVEFDMFTDTTAYQLAPGYSEDDLEGELTEIEDISAGQFGGVNSFAVALPLKYFNLGFGYTNPFDMKMKMLGSGIELITEMDAGLSTVTAALSIDMVLDFRLKSHQSSLVFARQFGPGFSGGITIDNYAYDFDFIGKVAPQGIITTNSDFDMTDKDYENIIDVQMDGRAIGTRLGVSYRSEGVFGFDLNYNYVPDIELTGRMEVVQDTIPLFDRSSPGKMNVDGMDLSNPLAGGGTISNPVTDVITLRQPRSLDAGISLHSGKAGVAFNYTKYFNEISFEFMENRQGLKLGSKFLFGLDARFFRMGLGLMTFDFVEEIPETSKSFITLASSVKKALDKDEIPFYYRLLPIFTLGFAFPVGEAINVNTNLFTLPVQSLRTTLTYNWDMKGLAKRAKKIDPNNIFTEAERLYQSGRYWDAATTFGHLIGAYPRFSKNNEALFLVAESFARLDLYAAALEAYNQMLIRFPNDKLLEQVFLGIGKIYYRQENHVKVKEQYQSMLKDFPNSKFAGQLAYLAGQCELADRNYKEAVAFYKQVATESESYKFAQYGAGLANLYLEDAKLAVQSFKNVLIKKAVSDAEKTLDLRTRLQLGYLYYELVDLTGAIAEFTAAADSGSAFADQACMGMAWSYLQQKKYKEGAACLEKVVKNHQQSGQLNEAYLVLGYSYSMLKDFDKAIYHYKKAISEASVPTGIRKTQVPALLKEKQDRVTALAAELSGKSKPLFARTIIPQSAERDKQLTDIRQEISLARVGLDSARSDLAAFNVKMSSLTAGEKILQDAKYALPTAEHLKSLKDKAQTDKAYDEKIKQLEAEMQKKLKGQQGGTGAAPAAAPAAKTPAAPAVPAPAKKQ